MSSKIKMIITVLVVLVLIAVLIFAIVSNNSVTLELDSAKEIHINTFPNSAHDKNIILTDVDVVNHICDNLEALELREFENCEPAIAVYNLTVLNENGEVLISYQCWNESWIYMNKKLYYSDGVSYDYKYIQNIIQENLQ